ncbi:hypothetical protein [Chryseobacterium indicum]|uniref:hypothetical protein n=1 Tax=Chryseobacterium indicum TaxID=2766954 RepID=UPI001F48AFD3|nr:hypothetical protein [Chryseobacterium sp. PS-8]
MGTYSIIYLKDSQSTDEVNTFLKEKFSLEYESFKGVDYGVFFCQAIFEEELRFLNEDEEGKVILSHFERPLSKETYSTIIWSWELLWRYWQYLYKSFKC